MRDRLRPLDRHRGHASAMLFKEHEKRRRKRPQDRFACAQRNRDFVCDRRKKNARRGDQVAVSYTHLTLPTI